MPEPGTASDHRAQATAAWEDIDSELNCSTREVCVGYGSYGGLPPHAIEVLRDAARRWGRGRD